MTRHIYRDIVCQEVLERIVSDLDSLRKNRHDHFMLGTLVKMEIASQHLHDAIREVRKQPVHVEEMEATHDD